MPTAGHRLLFKETVLTVFKKYICLFSPSYCFVALEAVSQSALLSVLYMFIFLKRYKIFYTLTSMFESPLCTGNANYHKVQGVASVDEYDHYSFFFSFNYQQDF